MTRLTPYDTGARLEPKLWLSADSAFKGITDDDEFGRVDFENEESNTVMTIVVKRNPDADGYVVEIDNHHGVAIDVVVSD